jgi:ferredoxin-thioredoxin reductase catalytic subunit
MAIDQERIEKTCNRLKRDAEAGGYILNPDAEFVRGLVEGLLTNDDRYGYPACPCRLASGDREDDLDIICPCDYRDPDLAEYGACYCALYVSPAVVEGRAKVVTIPERRPVNPEDRSRPKAAAAAGSTPFLADLPYPVWRCRVCGYLCAREGPPEVCPVCKAGKDRFERFL